MRSQLQGWRLSAHARERLADRAILPSELARLLEQPERVQQNPDKPHQEHWYRGDLTACIEPADRKVVTISIRSHKDEWERAAIERRAEDTSDYSAALLAAMPERPMTRHPPRRTSGRGQPVTAKVETSNVLDGAVENPRFRELAIKEARRLGVPVGSLRVIRPGVIEVVGKVL